MRGCSIQGGAGHVEKCHMIILQLWDSVYGQGGIWKQGMGWPTLVIISFAQAYSFSLPSCVWNVNTGQSAKIKRRNSRWWLSLEAPQPTKTTPMEPPLLQCHGGTRELEKVLMQVLSHLPILCSAGSVTPAVSTFDPWLIDENCFSALTLTKIIRPIFFRDHSTDHFSKK